ncbi:MAG: MlaD family protein [Syntrophobacteraceae bacterium]
MSSQANTKLIGGFVVGAMGLVILAIIAFGSGKLFGTAEKYILYFDGSVKGLTIGAPVVFRGVKIGSVVDVTLIFNPSDVSFRIPVIIEFEPDRVAEAPPDANIKPTHRPDEEWLRLFIENGLRAQLGTQSVLTGQLYVSLDLHPGTPVKLSGLKSIYPEIPTIPSKFEQIAQKLESLPIEEIAAKLHLAMSGIERLVNSPELQESKVALNETLKALHQLVLHTDSQIKPLLSNIQDTSTQARKLLGNVDSQVQPLVVDLRDAAKSLRELAKNSDKNLTPLLLSAQDMLDADSPLRYGLLKAVEDLAAAAKSLRYLADSLERNPEAVIRGKHRTGDK